MPFSPKFKIGTPSYSNLRQALQWINDGTKPVERAYEAALGIDDWKQCSSPPDRNYGRQKSELYLAICSGAIPLFGRPGLGEPIDDFCVLDCYFSHYGERQPISTSRLREAGFENLDFRGSEMAKVTQRDEYGHPVKGWGYSELLVPTADLMRIFPEDGNPPSIELKAKMLPQHTPHGYQRGQFSS